MAFCKVTHADGTESVISGAIGQYVFTAAAEPPAHTLEANGAAVSRTTYAKLFAVLGTLYGSGDGNTTFNLPDMRGRFVRGTGGNAATLGTEQSDAIRNMTGSFRFAMSQFRIGVDNCDGVFHSDGAMAVAWSTIASNPTSNSLVVLNASSQVPTAVENRPINLAATCCIVYE